MTGGLGGRVGPLAPRRLRALAAGLWTLVIWGQSLLPASQSSAESGQVLALLEPLLALTGLPPELWHTAVRKCAHMAEYTLLAALLEGLPRLAGLRRRLWSALSACGAAALTDETIQLFVPGRSGQVGDIWVDLAGALTGALLAALAGRLPRRRRPSNLGACHETCEETCAGPAAADAAGLRDRHRGGGPGPADPV